MTSEMEGGLAKSTKIIEKDKDMSLIRNLVKEGREKSEKETFATTEEKKGKGGLTKEELRMKERASSTSILDFVRSDNDIAGDLAKAKRKREKKEQLAGEIYKRGNKVRTPPGLVKPKDGAGDEGEESEEDGDLPATMWNEDDGSLSAVLREICAEMRDMRKEMKGMREKMSQLEISWNMREKRLEDRMDNIESRLQKMEQTKEDGVVEEKEVNIEGIVEKVAGIVEKVERDIREKKERRNKFVIRGLQKEENVSLKEIADVFLEKKFGVKDEVKKMQISGRVGKEVIIVEMNFWESKENIMKEKSVRHPVYCGHR